MGLGPAGAPRIPPSGPPRVTAAPILTPAATAAYGVISDMDDTVLQSEVTSFLRAARMVLLENARTRLPFAGVAAFYRALEEGPAGGPKNPIFYVSSSPWNLYDVIAGFLEAEGIPAGPLLLRDWDLGPSLFRNAGHKTRLIREILETFSALPFILIGDSAQEDPEIYAEIVAAHPSRILAVYIRSVEPHPERSAAIRRLTERVAAAGSTLVLADDTLTIASHASAHGWIREAGAAGDPGREAGRRGRWRQGGRPRRQPEAAGAHGRRGQGRRRGGPGVACADASDPSSRRRSSSRCSSFPCPGSPRRRTASRRCWRPWSCCG